MLFKLKISELDIGIVISRETFDIGTYNELPYKLNVVFPKNINQSIETSKNKALWKKACFINDNYFKILELYHYKDSINSICLSFNFTLILLLLKEKLRR